MLKVLYVNKKGLDFDIFVAADTVPCASKTVINQTFLFFSFFFFFPRLEGLKLTSSVQTPNLLCLKRILKISPHVLR